ncbi:hypothetical protein CDQ83_04355 [Clostridium thermosuccinogenes]|nr:hypothetical protein CDQ83_04355 [Pseudoclostridium thermosuccinogenes]
MIAYILMIYTGCLLRHLFLFDGGTPSPEKKKDLYMENPSPIMVKYNLSYTTCYKEEKCDGKKRTSGL